MNSPSDARRDKTCPICGKLTVADFRPFCSQRCADVDLNRWLSGVYAVPAAESDDVHEEPREGEAEDQP